MLLKVGVLLVLTALPDAMVVPILEEILVQRYGVGPGPAHAFLAVNLLGGLCALPILRWTARSGRPVTAVAVASACDALLLGAMWLPIGFSATILLRAIEGIPDVIVFAVIFDLVGRAGGRRSSGLRYGFAAALLSVALGGGAILGGQIAKLDATVDDSAPTIFLVGSSACLIASVLAVLWRGPLRRLEGLPVAAARASVSMPRRRRTAPLWPLLLIAGSDRAAGGLLTGTLGLFLAESVGLGPAVRGGLVGLVLLLMGLGAIPAGFVADRLDAIRVRAAGAIVFGAGIVVLPLAAEVLPVLGTVLIVMGVGGAVLLPTSLSLLDRMHGGLVGMGGFRAAGDIGFLIGVSAAGFLVSLLIGGETPAEAVTAYTTIFMGFGAIHLAATAIAIPVLARADAAESSSPGT